MPVPLLRFLVYAFCCLAVIGACTPTAPTATPPPTATTVPTAIPSGGPSAELAYLPYYDLSMTLLLDNPKLFTAKFDDSFARAAGLAANQTRQVSCLTGDGKKQKVTVAQCNALPNRVIQETPENSGLALAST